MNRLNVMVVSFVLCMIFFLIAGFSYNEIPITGDTISSFEAIEQNGFSLFFIVLGLFSLIVGLFILGRYVLKDNKKL